MGTSPGAVADFYIFSRRVLCSVTCDVSTVCRNKTTRANATTAGRTRLVFVQAGAGSAAAGSGWSRLAARTGEGVDGVGGLPLLLLLLLLLLPLLVVFVFTTRGL